MKFYRFLLILLTFAAVISQSSGLFAQDDDNTEEEAELKNFIKLDKVEFKFLSGQTFDESILEGIISIPKAEYFLTSDFYTDSKRIQKYYFDNGFLDAVVDTSSVFSAPDEVIATFTIDQKKRYKINKIIYNGLAEVDQAVLELIEKNKVIYAGKDYNKGEIQIEISRILSLLQNNGYALAQTDVPDVVKFITKDVSLENRVDIIFNFTPRDKYIFGPTKITLTNNKYDLSTEDLERELEYNEGEVYSKEKLVRSENRIAKIAIFENGRIQIDKIDSARNIISLKIEANVTNKYELKPEIFGYDISGRFFAGAGLTFTNKYFFGGGRVFTASLKFLYHNSDYYRYEGLATLFQPHLFNNDKITGNNSFGVTQQSLLDSSETQAYLITGIKNLASIKYDLPKYTYFNNLVTEWKLANDRIEFKFDLYNNDSTGVAKSPTINLFTSSLGFTAIHNGLDNITFPTTGTYATYAFEEAGLLGSLAKTLFNTITSKYFKVTTQNKIFTDISKETNGTSILGGKFVIGNIFDYGDNTFLIDTFKVEEGVVPNEANYLIGGSVSLRGWKAGTLGVNIDPTIGGKFIIDGSIEHRTKPFTKSDNFLLKDLGFATFLDFGNVWDSYKSFKFSDVAMAIGGGIRYYTIVGAFRFDIGFKLYDPDSPDQKWLFQSDIGTIFSTETSKKMAIQFGIGNTF